MIRYSRRFGSENFDDDDDDDDDMISDSLFIGIVISMMFSINISNIESYEMK